MAEAGMATDDQLEIRALARDFAAGEIRPHVERWDAERALDPEIFEKLGELGFMGMRVPESHGGLGLDVPSYLMALESLSWGDASVALTVAIHNGPVTHAVLVHGSDEQRARWLPLLASGERIGAFALSEPEAGSDPSGIETTATRTDSGWRFEGTKRWVTNGDAAGLLVVFARTAAAAGAGGEVGAGELSAFLVPRESPGITVEARERTLGFSASETVTLRFEAVEVGFDSLLGTEGGGFSLAMQALDIGRAGVAALALGVAQASYEHALRYAGEREQFGSPLTGFGAVQEKLAGMAIRIAQARALTMEVAGELESGATTSTGAPASHRARAAMAKVAASEAAMWSADEAVQIFGGYGYMRDYPVEKLMRDAKGMEIFEGASEVLRMLVAREAVREAG
jgi:acyl-CoA dehydrogenase